MQFFLVWYVAVAIFLAFVGVCDCIEEGDWGFFGAAAQILLVSVAWPILLAAFLVWLAFIGIEWSYDRWRATSSERTGR